MKIAIVGGTGGMGFGLGLRMAHAGHTVIIGSRNIEKANAALGEAKGTLPEAEICAMENPDACDMAELVIISVPSSGHKETLLNLKEHLAGKDVLDITVPLAFKPLRYEPPKEGSNALETLAVLGEGASVASGFHAVSATLLTDLDHPVDSHALVAGTSKELRERIVALGNEIGITTYDAGTLNLACALESQTPLLIGMNKRYDSKHIGFQFIGF